MAYFRGDGLAQLAQARQEQDIRRKLELMDSGLVLHFRELEHMFQNLGIENFNQPGLKEIRGEKSCSA